MKVLQSTKMGKQSWKIMFVYDVTNDEDRY